MRVLYYSLFIVLVDQVTKIIVKGISIPSLGIYLKGMPYQSSIKVFGDFFMLTFIENPGMAFGIQLGGKLFLSLFTIFATFLILYFIWRNRHESFFIRLALALILGGAVGNLIDRTFYGTIYGYAPLFFGSVVDFLHFNTPDFTILGKTFYSFPIFNVADISVSIGFVMIIFGYNKVFKETKTDNEIMGSESQHIGDEIIIENGRIIEKHDEETIITEIHSENEHEKRPEPNIENNIDPDLEDPEIKKD